MNTKNTTDALEAFTKRPTPANAIALAIADHRAQQIVDYKFLDVLRLAQLACQQRDTLLDELKRLVLRCDGAAGVREDGSNIDTLSAHYAINAADPFWSA